MLTRAELAAALPDTAISRRVLEKLVEVPPPTPGMGPCLMWVRARTDRGYGSFNIGGVTVAVHVWVWRQLNGPIPAGFEVHHVCHEAALGWCAGGPSCEHRACVAHLGLCTHQENMLRGNTFAARESAQDFCTGKYAPKGGHDLRDPANVYRPPGRENERHCRACNTARVAAHREKQRLLRAQGARFGEQMSLLES
jgi:hypothetical protein